ncbi:hypothetical protein [Phaeovulum vinaykumarii]|uniref:Uncharacterized protein n=1 Tax=Phaeovulum vinaykumarii TaxID=407234 RepID=A0A1N7M4R4_9RHOB|nr:hypothetical protein [Phaeovulum vinaykumarii]SIS81084.1 hypothetical protein SAMN05421795_105192 [Phaeovulum vinaykumarii]SOC08694.1 hypothetical protein SAMN05878426_10510 [Phaeovulum vinaykumarii]
MIGQRRPPPHAPLLGAVLVVLGLGGLWLMRPVEAVSVETPAGEAPPVETLSGAPAVPVTSARP